MAADPPHSLLITPDLRRRLQQRYEEAKRLSAAPLPEYRRIHSLLSECVRADPGNILYVDALLANLRQWRPWERRSWLPKWLRSWSRGSEPPVGGDENEPVLSTEYLVLRKAPTELSEAVGNVGVLSRFAEAAGALDFDQVQIRYLLEAQTILPSNAEIVRALSRALTRQGRFEEALTSWHELLELRPGDVEATRAAHDIENAPGKPTALEEKLKTGQTAGGDDLESVEAREELQLARLRHRLAIAQRRAVADSDRKAQRLVSDFENECLRLEIEIFHLRCERFPGDSSVRLELARRLKQAGNFSGAIQRLEEADRLRPYDPPVLLELGECWQHLRQFAKALDSYRAAIVNSPAQSNVWMLALYRAGVLTAGMGKFSEARSHFEPLVAVQPDYKDARARLDNLPAN